MIGFFLPKTVDFRTKTRRYSLVGNSRILGLVDVVSVTHHLLPYQKGKNQSIAQVPG